MISIRSSSFPSRKSQHLTTTSFSSLSSIDEKLHNLENLHKNVDNLLLSPHTHHIFAQHRHEKWVDDILDGYLSLVDACAMAQDFISHSKEYILNIQSFLRRRRDHSDDQLCKLISSRKIMKKNIQKSLRSIMSFKNKSSISVTVKDREIVAIFSMLKEAESATLDLFQALLSSMVGAKGHSRPNVWFLVSKLVRSRKVSCEEHKCTTTLDFGDLDAKLVNLRASKCESGEQIEELQKQLTDMDSTIQVVEEKLESLFKHLIRSRVSLLNMQSQL